MDIDILRANLVQQINNGYHLQFFEDRLKLMTYQEYSEHGKGLRKEVNVHAVTSTAIIVDNAPKNCMYILQQSLIPLFSLTLALSRSLVCLGTASYGCFVSTFVLGVPEDTLAASLCQELVLKICHTLSNDFLRNVCTLKLLKEKRVDLEMSLTDELK